jgi:hypothetical protein
MCGAPVTGTFGRALARFCCLPGLLLGQTRSTVAKSRTDLIVDRLRELQAATPEIVASAVVSVDGLTIASVMPPTIEEDRVSAMAAAMLAIGERIASELRRGTMEQVYVKGAHGYVMLMAIGSEAVLTGLVSEGARLGLIFMDMRRAAEHLRSLI